MSGMFDVNGAAIDASSGDSETPTCAVRRALQSFAPSPHMQTVSFSSLRESTSIALCSGDIRAKMKANLRMFLKNMMMLIDYFLEYYVL